MSIARTDWHKLRNYLGHDVEARERIVPSLCTNIGQPEYNNCCNNAVAPDVQGPGPMTYQSMSLVTVVFAFVFQVLSCRKQDYGLLSLAIGCLWFALLLSRI